MGLTTIRRIRKRKADNKVYLCAPVNSLVEGIYEQNIPFSEIKKHGDFGLGTFNDLDGEMMMVDGEIFRVGSDGKVNQITDEEICTPFACVTNFQPASDEILDKELNYNDFLKWMIELMPSPNIFYAFRITGDFAYVKTRSVPKQENYRPLVEVAKEQPTFEFHNVSGLMVGFYTPHFVSSISVPGVHLHFLTDDKSSGGHLLECRPKNIKIELQYLYTLELSLPSNLDYLTWDFQRDIGKDLDKAEK
ncbi:MAG TPA: acetolactate decarboxylase [Anaerolineae bacterium]|nr:acetolactate decarboxylase [Anaerolineae bacterium]